MKIVSTVTNEENLKLINALSIINNGLLIFNPTNHNTSLSDIMYKEEPDLLFIDNSFVNPYTQLILDKYKDTKVILFGNYIDHNLQPDLVCLSDNVSDIIKKNLINENVAYIKDFCNPYLTNSYYFTNNINEMSCVINNNLEFDNKLSILIKIAKIAKIKIYGNCKIPMPEYLGKLNTNDILSLYKSSNIVLDFDSNNLMDLAFHRIFTLTTVENDIFPTFKLDNIIEQYHKFKSNKNRNRVINSAYDIVKNETVLHRLKDILTKINICHLIETIDTKLNEL